MSKKLKLEKRKHVRHVAIGVALVLFGASPGIFHELTKQTSEKLIKRAYKECEEAGPMQEICAFVTVKNACEPRDGKYLDLKICGIVR